MKSALFISLTMLALVLADGCNFAPKYKRPPVQTPAAFKETNGWKLAQPSDGVIKGKWWEMFEDPELNALEEQVAVSNQNVQAALETFFAARAVVKEARSAYYPTASAAPAVGETHPSRHLTTVSSTGTALGTSAGSSKSQYTTFMLPVDASWEPDFWGAVRNTVRADTYAAQSDAALYQNMKLMSQADLAVDYYELRSQDETIKLYRDTVKAYRDSLDLTTTLYKTGIDSELNEAQADALLETTLAQATALEIQRAQYEHAIALLVGQPASTFSVKTNLARVSLPMVPVGVPSTLLERRPDIASSERLVAAANAQIGVTRAAWFPTISLTGSAGYESTRLNDLFSPGSFFWDVAASGTELLFDGGQRIAANQQALASFRIQVANYRETVLAAFQQVEDNLAGLRVLSRETQQQDVAIKASQKSLDLSLEQYRQGIASYLNVISAQETLLGNQQTAVTIRMEQMVDTVQLIMALGGGWTNSYLPSPPRLVLKTSPDSK